MDAQPKAGLSAIELLRVVILSVLVLGLLGTVTELVLLEHYEEPLQFVPLILIVAAMAGLVWHMRAPTTASLMILQIVMALSVLAGFFGMLAHFHGSAEYQLELNPEMPTAELLEKIMRAKAPPLLAPGMMVQLGLLGLAYVYSDAIYRPDVLRFLQRLGIQAKE
jgi:hypothetical protein